MKLWRKNRNRERRIAEARAMAAGEARELERVRSQWPQVNRISAELAEQSELNHLGSLVAFSMQRRHA